MQWGSQKCNDMPPTPQSPTVRGLYSIKCGDSWNGVGEVVETVLTGGMAAVASRASRAELAS